MAPTNNSNKAPGHFHSIKTAAAGIDDGGDGCGGGSCDCGCGGCGAGGIAGGDGGSDGGGVWCGGGGSDGCGAGLSR